MYMMAKKKRQKKKIYMCSVKETERRRVVRTLNEYSLNNEEHLRPSARLIPYTMSEACRKVEKRKEYTFTKERKKEEEEEEEEEESI